MGIVDYGEYYYKIYLRIGNGFLFFISISNVILNYTLYYLVNNIMQALNIRAYKTSSVIMLYRQ